MYGTRGNCCNAETVSGRKPHRRPWEANGRPRLQIAAEREALKIYASELPRCGKPKKTTLVNCSGTGSQ